jgi:cold shock CspA family protein
MKQPAMAKSRLLGKVEWFKAERGFGVILGDDSTEYFAHHTNIPSHLSLYQGMRVSFWARPRTLGKDGMEAYDVQCDDSSLSPTTLQGVLDHYYSGTGLTHIGVAGGNYYEFWHDGNDNSGSLAPDQEHLRLVLENTNLDQQTLWPLVSLETGTYPRLAQNVRWQGESQEVLALPRGTECIVLDNVQNRSMLCWRLNNLEGELLKGKVHYLAQDPDSSDVHYVFVPTGTLSRLEVLEKADVRAALTKNRYYPEVSQFLEQWLRDAVDPILDELEVVAIDVEVRHGKIKEIGVCDSRGKIRSWRSGFEQAIRNLSEDSNIALLVGHNIAWDLQHLERTRPDTSLLRLPIVDTLVLAAILKPRSRQSLRLGGHHQAGEDARDTMQLLRRQIVDLAHLPEEQLVRWKDMAGPGLRQLLTHIVKRREELTGSPQIVAPDEKSPPNKNLLQKKRLPVEQLNDLLRAFSGDERILVLSPRSLLPLFADLEHTNILDPDSLYIEESREDRTAHLRNIEREFKVPVGDLLIYASAFVRESRICQQSTHEACMTDWARIMLKSDRRFLSSIGSAYDNVRGKLNEAQARRTVVPIDALRNQEFLEQLQAEQFNHVLLVGPEIATGELRKTIPLREAPSWQPQLLPSSDGGIIGLTEQGLEQWQIGLPSGWRGWLVDTLAGHREIHAVPKEPEKYFKSIFPDTSLTTLTLSDASRRIHVADVRHSKEQLWLTPATTYRADYLGQVAGFVVPLAQQKRVLLILRDQDEARRMRQALQGQGIYVPRGTMLTQMERLTKNGAGLAIGHENQLIGWVLRAQAHDLQMPFDVVVAEAWPVDAPELIPPPTREEIKELRRCQSRQREQTPENDEEMPLDDEPGQSEEEDLVFSVRSSAPSLSDILVERLKEHTGVLSPFVWAARRLSKKPLLVLDSRFPARKVRDIGKCIVESFSIDFDGKVAERVQQELDQAGLRRHREGSDVPRREEWNNLARNLFNLPGDLHERQEKDLARIMLGGHRTLTVESQTGSGKSLVFQFPALVQGSCTGLLTLVISPLRALMHEQCQKLWQLGFVFVVEAISSDLSSDEVNEAYQRLADGQIQLLFVAPERFRSRSFRRALRERLRRDRRLQYWVFDEAHCISLWGHDFRPDYFYAAQEAHRLRKQFSEEIAPVVLLSATLPAQVINELERIFEHGDSTS